MLIKTEDITRAITQGMGAASFHRGEGGWTLKPKIRGVFVAAIQIMDFEEYADLMIEAFALLDALESDTA
jgi:hypothetical protein